MAKRSTRVRAAAGSAGAYPRPPDAHLWKMMARRRRTLLLARRVARVSVLHLVDAVMLTAVALVLSSERLGDPGARALVPALVGVFLLSLNARSAYRPGDARRDRNRLFSAVLIGSLVLLLLCVLPPHLPLSGPFLLAMGAAGFVALSAGRQATDQLVRQLYLRGIGLRRALLIGGLDEVGRAIQQLRDDRNVDQYLIGHLAPVGVPDPTSLGALDELPDLLHQENVQDVILATALPSRTLREVAECCFRRGVTLYVFPAVLGEVEYRAQPVRVAGCPLLHLFPARTPRPSRAVKRVFDLVFGTLAMIASVPLMLLIGVAIRLDSSGPVFYRQQRVGLGGRRFTMWKFRSMRVGAEQARSHLEHLNAYPDRRLFKLPNDPRITRVGRFLRRSSLDELPQLINVLRGEMSLVGPRPPLPEETESYEPHHFDRLSVLPGITGPWQVGGRNLITDFEEVVQMERAYIHSWSLLLDLKILLRTVKVVVRGEGAY